MPLPKCVLCPCLFSGFLFLSAQPSKSKRVIFVWQLSSSIIGQLRFCHYEKMPLFPPPLYQSTFPKQENFKNDVFTNDEGGRLLTMYLFPPKTNALFVSDSSTVLNTAVGFWFEASPFLSSPKWLSLWNLPSNFSHLEMTLSNNLHPSISQAQWPLLGIALWSVQP